MVRNIPEEIPLEWASVPDMQGAWVILQPLEADLHLVQSGHLVSGTYCNSKIEGTSKELSLRREKTLSLSCWGTGVEKTPDFRMGMNRTPVMITFAAH